MNRAEHVEAAERAAVEAVASSNSGEYTTGEIAAGIQLGILHGLLALNAGIPDQEPGEDVEDDRNWNLLVGALESCRTARARGPEHLEHALGYLWERYEAFRAGGG